jgi:hypothetical protein
MLTLEVQEHTITENAPSISLQENHGPNASLTNETLTCDEHEDVEYEWQL